MKILVISDTHIPTTVRQLPPAIESEARKCSCCLHAGDIIDCDTLDRLSQLTTVYAVCGNMDNPSIIDKLPKKIIVSLGEVKIALTHGHGSPMHIIESVDMIFAEEKDTIDAFVFGHSHVPCNQKINGKLYFNPGSPTDTIFAPKRTYGILEIAGKEITGRIIDLG
ncbi:MAG: metallophosphoesterase [Candidatus Omnitrophica bacterium]|nr:metallophosphoesterase [Candidatus Omnitrophota bacterium]